MTFERRFHSCSARLGLITLLLAAPVALAWDPTTYIVALPGADYATMTQVEALGGAIDHFDGTEVRAYIHHAHWDAFLTAGIPHTLRDIQPNDRKQLDGYPSYAELATILADTASAYPDIVRLETIGRSIQGRELWAVRITDAPDTEEDEPEFAYLSTMHGDETVGTVLCLNFLDTLVTGYGQDATITDLINDTVIWLLPLMNPDGYEAGVRWNANNQDLNRSFPQFPSDFSGTLFTEGPPDTTGREPEVAHVMNWSAAHRFVLSANYHGGALVVNYPYDEIPGIPSGQDAPTPDDALMRMISLTYANLNPPLSASRNFPNGISNGSAWFRISGGMQDWHYRFAGQIDVTLEISEVKSPGENQLASFWEDNRFSMMAYLALVHRGIRGLVTDKMTGTPLFARVLVDDNPQPVFTDPDVGDFHRMLLPGTYRIRVDAPGYVPYTTEPLTVTDGMAVRSDTALSDGDVNRDGSVDAVDLQLVVNTVLGLENIEDADVDGGGVSATDIQHLVNRVLGRQ